jgi:hypothetical protein
LRQNSTSLVFETGGEILSDGTVLELVSDASKPDGVALLKWERGEFVIGPQVVHRGRTFAPLALEPTIRRALRLPIGPAPFGSTEAFFGELVALFTQFTGLAEHFCQFLAAFVLASWLADTIPTPVNVSLWSPFAANGARVLLLLSCVCRLPLALAGIGSADLRLLPDTLPATLLIFHLSPGRRIRDWIAASGWRGFRSARSGRLVEIVGAKVFSTDTPLGKLQGCPILEIPVAPPRRPLPVLDEQAQNDIAVKFLPKALQFRLTRCHTFRKAWSDVSSNGSTTEDESGLLACFADAPKLEKRIRLLLEAELDSDETKLSDPRVVLLDVLLARCHEHGRRLLHVADVAIDLNALLVSRGEAELTDRMVGSLLKSLDLRTRQLDRAGRGIILEPRVRSRIHELAATYGLRSAMEGFPGCDECTQSKC